MFTGFNVSYPEYEVIVPSGLSFTIRSLNVQEEEKMKGSMMTPTKTADHLNKLLYDLTIKKPDIITDFTSFLQNVTLKDRDVLVYALYHITYDEIRNYDVTCKSCNKSFPITVKASDTFNMTMFPDNNVLTKRVTVPLPVLQNVNAFIKQPTLYDETTSIKNLSSRPGSTLEIITECLILDHFEQNIPEKVAPIMISEKVDIIDAYFSLPARDKRAIYDSYANEFGKYGLDLKIKTFCTHCDNEEVVGIDIVSNFFRTLYGL